MNAAEKKRAPKALERELSELARHVPEIDYMFARRSKVSALVKVEVGDVLSAELQGALLPSPAAGSKGTGETNGTGDTDQQAPMLEANPKGHVPSRVQKRNSRRGPTVRLVHDPARPEMSWLEPDSVIVNTAHPAYVKSQREGQVKYHRRLAALVALCSGAAEEDRLELLSRAIAVWGSR